MDWFWRPTAPQPPPTPSCRDEKGDARAPIPPPAAADSASKPPPTRDELAEAEWLTMLAELQAQASPPSPPSSAAAAATTGAAAAAPSPSAHDAAAERRLRPYSPTVSCSTALDLAWFCQSPGGQFVSVYRHGTLRNCSALWSDFWFCMRTNRGFMSDDERADRVRRHYREREDRLLRGRNSEEVWEARTAHAVGAFQQDLDEGAAATRAS